MITYYRTVGLDDLNVLFREAGSADAPAILLLHGFPTSSHMFRELIPALADRYHVLGRWQSAAPRLMRSRLATSDQFSALDF